MKKLIYLSIIFLALLSCSSGEDNSQNNNVDNALLQRKWFYYSETYQGKTHYFSTCTNGNKDYLEFKASSILNYYYVISNTNCNYTSEGPFNWIKKGNTVSVYHNNTLVRTLIINELTATTLIFEETDAVSKETALYVYNSY